MKVSRLIIIANVLICFLLNNLLFTYSPEVKAQKSESKSECTSADDCCSSNEDDESSCCEKDNCCANIPAPSHNILPVIIGVAKHTDNTLSACQIDLFNNRSLKQSSDLSDGYCNSLIKPPAV